MLNRIPDHFANHQRLRQEILDFAGSAAATQPKIAVLTGPPGIGKTALALRTAHDLPEPEIRLYARLDTDPEAPGAAADILGQFLVDLGMDPAAVPDRISARANAFRARTAGRQVLLIIDGATTAAQVRALLPADGLVLVTEARPLSIDARNFALPPLDTDAARTLLAGTEPDHVEEIIELAQGNPLLLRIAAALPAGTPPGTDLLTTAYRTLSAPAQRCYRTLALPGTTAEISTDALGLPVDELVAARLVERLSETRIHTSELVRNHARAIEPPDPDETARLRERYLTRTASAYRAANRWPQAEPWFTCPPGTESVDLAWLDAERGNIRAAIEHAATVGHHELVATWCVLLWPFYEHGKHTADLLTTHQLGLNTASRALRSLLLTRIGFAHLFNGDTEQAIAACEQARDLATDPKLEATALEGLGLALLADDQDDRARPVLRRNLDLARQLAESRRIALACLHDAKVERPEIALPLLTEAARTFAADPVNMAKTHLWRGRKLTDRGDFAEARTALDLAIAELTAQRRPFDRAEALAARGDLNAAAGQPHQARDDYGQARAVFEEWGFSRRAARLPG
ncbi:MAG TPA: ATP-binding protein [Pseudonocardiaceae bacterium]|nr:ATP-binding protein [Pseudonocardiaceae bacterium]